MKKDLIIITLSLLSPLFAQTLTLDGTYVGGDSYNLTPDGNYVGEKDK